MRVAFILLIVLSISCKSTNNVLEANNKLYGEYILDSDKMFQAFSEMNYHSIILNADSTYILKKAEIKFTPSIEQCEIASKGKWSVLSNNILKITSEDKYLKQKGFNYEIKKENKLSQDSLYIKINLPAGSDEFPIKYSFYFNSNVSKYIETQKTFIAIPKSKHLKTKKLNLINNNRIDFSINANVSGTYLYKSRILFKIFEEDIDTEKTNYLTITLPYFDSCFLEFEPFNNDLIYIKNNSQLFWKGDTWKK
ncbi:hypothetical protein INQ45_14240 [Flavobacterium columnare]|uniref:hypothetical protein n=1 Tax=Flavobacterium columnare TaxID=996 RepID=UPI002D20339B|nr:hypothetical protein [Flavobacterium columnare]MEB3802177.1 hypothetical protein [Flavobacterium columnare]